MPLSKKGNITATSYYLEALALVEECERPYPLILNGLPSCFIAPHGGTRHPARGGSLHPPVTPTLVTSGGLGYTMSHLHTQCHIQAHVLPVHMHAVLPIHMDTCHMDACVWVPASPPFLHPPATPHPCHLWAWLSVWFPGRVGKNYISQHSPRS